MYQFQLIDLRQRNMIFPNWEISSPSPNKKWHLLGSLETFGSPSKASLSPPYFQTKSSPNKISTRSIWSSALNLKTSDKLMKRILNSWSKSNYQAILKTMDYKVCSILKSSKWLAGKYILNFVKATFQVFQLNPKFSFGNIILATISLRPPTILATF